MGYAFLAIIGAAALFLTMLILNMNPVPLVVAYVQSDDTRLAAIDSSGSENDGIHTLFQSVKLNNRDVAILRRDVRRAIAAYPDIDEERLLTSRWFAFDTAARVPSKGFWNSHGTQDPITKEYYLESACMSVVRPEYKNRADDTTTDRFFAERKAARRAERIERLKTNGPFAMWSGTGGSMSVRLDKNSNTVIVQRAEEWSSVADRWSMPFVADEWVDINEGNLDAIKKLPSFEKATLEKTDVQPSGVSISMGNGSYRSPTQGLVIPPGGTIGVSVPLNSR